MRATHRLADDFVHQAQGFEPQRRDAQRISRLLGFIRRFPQNRGAALGADHRINRVLHHDELVGHRNRQGAARATLANDGGDDGHLQLRHLENIAANGLGLAALLGVNTRVGARRIDKSEHRQLELFG